MMSAKQICFLVLIVAVVCHDVFVVGSKQSTDKHVDVVKPSAKLYNPQTEAEKGVAWWWSHPHKWWTPWWATWWTRHEWCNAWGETWWNPWCRQADAQGGGSPEAQVQADPNVALLNDEISTCNNETEVLREQKRELCTRLTATFTGDDICQVECEDRGYRLLPLLPHCEDGDWVDGVNCCIDAYEENDCFRTPCPPKASAQGKAKAQGQGQGQGQAQGQAQGQGGQ